ncbi:MAG: hypothetical protein AAF378_16200 [Cyanobacteria bacterium P01_A01_bin.84]
MGEAKRRKKLDPNYGKPKAITHAQRANKMYKLVFDCIMPIYYTEEDDPVECELAVTTWAELALSERAVPTHPLKRFKTVSDLLNWFNRQYPILNE